MLSRGFSGAFIITDLATDRYKVYATNDKTECARAVKKYALYLLGHGWRLRHVYTDAGTVETSEEYREELAKKGITVHLNPDKIPQYHVERTIQTMQNDITTIIDSTPTFKRKHWLPAATFAAELRATCANSICRYARLFIDSSTGSVSGNIANTKKNPQVKYLVNNAGY